jgi:hypothetical protein
MTVAPILQELSYYNLRFYLLKQMFFYYNNFFSFQGIYLKLQILILYHQLQFM